MILPTALGGKKKLINGMIRLLQRTTHSLTPPVTITFCDDNKMSKITTTSPPPRLRPPLGEITKKQTPRDMEYGNNLHIQGARVGRSAGRNKSTTTRKNPSSKQQNDLQNDHKKITDDATATASVAAAVTCPIHTTTLMLEKCMILYFYHSASRYMPPTRHAACHVR